MFKSAMGKKCQEMDKFAILVGWGGIPKKMGGRNKKLKYSGKLEMMSWFNASFSLNAP